MGFSPEQVAEILELMRGGETVQIGGSRAHATYLYRDGAWRLEDFDEGYVQEYACSEVELRRLIRREPRVFRALLQRPRWARFSDAFLAGEGSRALALLDEALRYGDSLHHGQVLRAFLLDRATRSQLRWIREKLHGYTAYHVFMEAACWDQDPATAAKGVLFVDRLIGLAGEVPGAYEVRATFQEAAGEREAAIRDLERDLALTPADDWRREKLQEKLARLRGEGA